MPAYMAMERYRASGQDSHGIVVRMVKMFPILLLLTHFLKEYQLHLEIQMDNSIHERNTRLDQSIVDCHG